ncbi:NHL domain-containing thioredoxin family protein [Luteimicrobium subarcticum]|uniref:NHL domain-containing thioredoxin family protein n=1 Tax=Luteimicrobium subarcticum TaxID=620910 RepID=UPI000C230419|nr:NHL domain-containing thioredoxin family protein [Luteimicrobium subarcticum]
MTTAPPRLPRVRASELVGRGWLNTGGKDVTLADLRGRVVLLDFWTFCCINCLHVLDELRDLEQRFGDVLTIVGVHSPKFEHEADPVALAAAVERYEVHHPVLDDPDLVTWQAYTARAWPTLVVVDPEGYVVAQMAGEGHAANVEALVAELVAEHRAKGTLREGDGPYVPPEPTAGTLRFPAKAVALPGGNLLVADAGHHALTELAPDGETLVRRVGSGERGLVDGGPDDGRFAEPGGLALVPADLRGTLGYDVVVADTANHVLRGVRLADGTVTTLAGTGDQYMVGAPDNVDPERGVRLSSPWDVLWVPDLGAFVVAMAGNHTLWTFDPVAGTITQLAGTMNEGLQDGPLAGAWFAQPSGLALALDDDGRPGRVWVADSETSAVRWFDPRRDTDGATGAVTVHTAVGQGLFDFGHRDGAADQALLQHPLGVAALPDGSVLVADTYNGAVRRVVPARDGTTGQVTTLATGLAEPSGLVVLVDGAPWAPGRPGDGPVGARLDVLVVESAAHRLTRVALPADLVGDVLDGGARRTQRPVTEIVAGALRLEVPFRPAPGQKLDDRYGPSTRLRVSSTPPELLLAGAGDGTDLARDLVVNPDVDGGVLHVTAQAASCDADPAIEFPACHLAQQDWGVPVRVVPTAGEPALTLPLLG